MQKQSESAERPPRVLAELVIEFVFVAGFMVLQLWAWLHLPAPTVQPFALMAGLFSGWVAADLLSGTLHFLADNFGSRKTPFVGPALIATFREHHALPNKMLTHGFLERNGWNCAGAIVLGAPVLLLEGSEFVFLSSALLTCSLFLAMTNQIHAWSHAPERPKVVRRLQSWGIILDPRQHQAHHLPFEATAPPPKHQTSRSNWQEFANGHYCITSGVCDRIFSRLLEPGTIVFKRNRFQRNRLRRFRQRG